MILKCKSLFNGCASVGSQFVEYARKHQEDIVIEHKGRTMTLRPFMFGKFFEMGKRKYRDKKNPNQWYTLQYIRWEPDNEKDRQTNSQSHSL